MRSPIQKRPCHNCAKDCLNIADLIPKEYLATNGIKGDVTNPSKATKCLDLAISIQMNGSVRKHAGFGAGEVLDAFDSIQNFKVWHPNGSCFNVLVLVDLDTLDCELNSINSTSRHDNNSTKTYVTGPYINHIGTFIGIVDLPL